MKNTTFRKKALLSSVAMLLVALVALGSATFAWFTANPKASASGISLKTTASTGLVIKTDTDSTWSHNAALYKGQQGAFNLTPVSQEQGTPDNFWTVQAAAANDEAAKSGESMTAATAGTDFYKENVYFRLSDGSALETTKNVYLNKIEITAATGATMQNCIRVAVADKGGKLLGTYCLSSAGAQGTLTTAAQTTGSFNPALATAVPAEGVKVLNGSDLTADGADVSEFVTVYVYLDGQDADCYSDKVGTVNATEIISSVKCDFELR